MNFTERLKRASRYDRITRSIQSRFRKEIIRLKNDYIDLQCANWAQYGSLSDVITNQLTAHLDKVFFKYQSRIIKLITEETTLQLSRQNRKFSKWEYYLRVWITAQGGRMAREVANTTFNDLNILIMSAFEAGQDESVVIRAGLLAKNYSAFRADTIARTETHNAATFAAESTARDIGSEVGVKMVKVWQPVVDERTRIDHAAMAGKPAIPMDEMFVVGGVKMSRPGDLNAPPEQVINCRCVCLYDTVEEY